jgi:hypothetical protein
MARKSIADILKAKDSGGEKSKKRTKKSSADRKRLTIGSAKTSRAKIPKITKIFKSKTAKKPIPKKPIKRTKLRKIKKVKLNVRVVRRKIFWMMITRGKRMSWLLVKVF